MRVIYTAAHAVDGSESVPLGGGAAISRLLTEEWGRTRPFELRVIGPEIIGRGAPSGRDIVGFSESEYAQFCRSFEAAATEEILRQDPAQTVVLANDISEGPDFARLRRARFRVVSIFHVDVVDYIASIYLRNRVPAESTVRWFRCLRMLPMPEIVRLIWQKQSDCVEHSDRLVVPSAGMQSTLERCYPRHAGGKVTVLPWGAAVPVAAPESTVEAMRGEFGIEAGTRVLLTLSRISPEKGQHVLLEALLEWERSATPPEQQIVLLLCGDAAYMQGRRYHDRLRQLAGRLSKIRVHFPGHVTGERKAACFAMADLYACPSVHESYGLTLMEALRAGVPAICLPSHGAHEVMRPGVGEVVPREQLWRALERWLGDEAMLREAGEAARAYGAENTFGGAANALAAVLQHVSCPS
ncbi:MAG: glycosyltransferase family 4 protein [Bryobacterales bacterium]|nr:glycosyltransferase family 4 protein [Bryobacterales bacterium]